MTDYASEWDSLPAPTAAPAAGGTLELHGMASPGPAPVAQKDYGAEWDALPSGAAAPPAPPKSSAQPAPQPPATSKPIDLSQDDLLREAGRGAAEIGTHLAKSTAGAVAQGLGNIYDVVRGGSIEAPLTTGARMSDFISGLGGEPQTAVGRYGSQALDYLGSLPMRFIGQPLGDLAERLGAPPAVSALASTAGAVAGPAALGRAVSRAVPRETVPAARVEPGALGTAEGASPGGVAGAGAGGGAAGEPIPTGAVGGGAGGGGTNARAGAGTAVPGVSASAGTSVPTEFEGIAAPAEQLPVTAQVSNSARQFFPAVKKSTIGADLPEAAQQERAGVMRAIGISNEDGFRNGALTGNPKTQASEVMTSNVAGDVGAVYQQKLADEQMALRRYGQQIKDMAGGTQSGPELPQEQAQYIRGQNIVKPLDMLDDWFNSKANDLYAQWRSKNAGATIESKNLDGLLSDGDFRQRLVATGNRQLLDSLDSQVSRFHKEGWGDQQGPNSLGAAESFRQWLNGVAKDAPNARNTIAQVKEALDTDAAAAGGGPKDAREFWANYKKILSDPKGISSLLEDKQGNRTVPFNQVPQKLAGMQDFDQFGHIIGTLKGIRNIEGIDPAIVDASNKALQEVRQQFAENAVNAGGTEKNWNPDNFNNTLNKNAYRMGQVFTPAELKTFRTLNDGGFILENRHAYPGAAVQGVNLLQSMGIKAGAGLAGAAAELAAGGGMTGGAAAGFAGTQMGTFLSNRMTVARARQVRAQMLNNAEKYFPSGATP